MSEDVPKDDSISLSGLAEVMDNRDWFLTNILERVVPLGLEMGITLTIGGACVSGQLISGRKYFEELGATMRAASTKAGDAAETLGNAWEQFKEIYEQSATGEDEGVLPAGYIHIKDARFFAPGHPPLPNGGSFLWRGKISSVDGFAIGQLQPE